MSSNELSLEEMTRRAIKKIESSKKTIKEASSEIDFRARYER